MISVLWEIIVPLLIAFAIGVLVGWLLWRWRRTKVSITEWDEITNLADSNRSGIIDLRDQRNRLGGELKQVSGQLEATRKDLAVSGEELEKLSTLSQSSQAAVGTLEGDLEAATRRVVQLEAELEVSTARVDELDGELASATARIADLEGDLRTSLGRTNEMKRELETAGAKVTMLESDMSTATARVTQLEGELESARARADQPTADSARAWVAGTTKLGTFGARHFDDLKVINGIGPMMEGVLNEFGIVAWEQIAALTPEEVARVSDAIETFPGRIERDEWVSQAEALVTQFPDPDQRPTRETFLNASGDDDPWS